EADPYAVRLRELARTVSPQDIQLFYQTLLVGRKELLLAPDRRSGTEMTFLRALAFHPKKVSAPVASGAFDAMAAAGQSPSRAPVSNAAPIHSAPTNIAPAHHAAPVNTAAMPAASAMQSGHMPAQAPMQMQQAHMPPSQAPLHAAAGRVAPSMPPAAAPAAMEPSAAAPVPMGDNAPVAGFPAGSADSPALQALQAREQLRRQRHAEPSAGEGTSTKKATPVAAAVTLRPAGNKPSPLERLAAAGEQRVRPSAGPRTADSAVSSKAKKPEAYRWKPVNPVEEAPEVVTPDVVRSSLEHEKTPEMALKLAQEACERDSWSAQIEKLNVAKLVEQLALNAVKEEPAPGQVRLLLRSSQRHLNTDRAKEQLSEALSQLAGAPVTLEIIENDDKTRLTPLEIRQAIYDEKLAQARQSLQDDKNILQLRRLFGADLEDDSIRPL
ncbi:MAG: DNA polymerase III subunit gamma/tau C-terminal domain-containing protein, partial [Plesiomonas shigelloides]